MSIKGKAPTAMTTETRSSKVHAAMREAGAAAEASCMTSKARRGATYPHHHQAAPMAAVVAVDWHDLAALEKIRHST
jgi:hypothetical protein